MGEAGDGDDEGLQSLSVLPCLLLEFKPHPLKEQLLFPSTFHPISDFPPHFSLNSHPQIFFIVYFSHFIVIVL